MESLARSGNRHERGVILAREKFPEIIKHGRFTWAVPSCTTPGVVYLVTVQQSRGHEVCSCDDFLRRERRCKHVWAVLYLRARSGSCCGCGARRWNRDLVEVHEEDHLTWFVGDQLCEGCADSAGVIR